MTSKILLKLVNILRPLRLPLSIKNTIDMIEVMKRAEEDYQ